MPIYSSSKLNFLQLTLVTHRQGRGFAEYKNVIQMAIEGGATCIQLREKNTNEEEIAELAFEFLGILKPYKVPLIINDYVNVCKRIKAHGVHLGQDDMCPSEARAILGNNAVIGWSIENFSQLKEANKLNSITYISASSLFSTSSKLDYKTIWGIEKLKVFCKRAKHPVMAIGGINNSNINSVLQTGVCGVAVINAIHEAKNPYIATYNLRQQINRHFEGRLNDASTN